MTGLKVLRLLCTQENTTLEEIKKQLEERNITYDGIIDTLKELKNEIPGIVRTINEDGQKENYSIRINATKILDEYKQSTASPRISNTQDGIIEFIVRSDLHFKITSSEEAIKKIIDPYMEFCTINNNIPIIDLGDLAETLKGIKYISWKNFDKNTIKNAYKFYRNYAKSIQTAPNIKHYTLLGNHDEHPYLAGVDPLEILYEYSDNFVSLGVSSGSFKLGNDKIGVYHDKKWQNVISPEEYKKKEREEYLYEFICEETENIAKDYIYSLIGHYHFGKHNPNQNFSIINNGIESSLLFSAQIKDGHVEKMYVTELYLNGTQVKKSYYKTEIYNRGNQYRK